MWWPFSRRPARPLGPADRALIEQVRDLERRLTAVEHFTNLLHDRELTRAAEHHAMVDRLDRLYKRISARISYADAHDDTSNGHPESVATLKKRLGK